MWRQANHIPKVWNDIARAGDLPGVVENSCPIRSDDESATPLADVDILDFELPGGGEFGRGLRQDTKEQCDEND